MIKKFENKCSGREDAETDVTQRKADKIRVASHAAHTLLSVAKIGDTVVATPLIPIWELLFTLL